MKKALNSNYRVIGKYDWIWDNYILYYERIDDRNDSDVFFQSKSLIIYVMMLNIIQRRRRKTENN